ncbi:phosphatidic acid phosphatase type 2/haloperoxidase [Pilobolus umbonatus]|nr:phosphatidic acid phosphatase type 2/haloperoxidase [Pilobolus umbonatus]
MLGVHFHDDLKKRLFLSYGRDWLLVIIMTAVFFAIDVIEPFHREFSINNTSLMHPFAVNESVPVWALAVLAFVTPIIIIACVSLLIRRSWLDFHSGILGLCLALSITIMITDVIKITVGYPRPDMFDRCQPPPGIENPPLQLLNYTICTTDPQSHIMREGFKSFPSGHSSFSFAGLGYLSFYLAGKMHLFDEGGHTYKPFVFSFPFLGALLVAISRLRDYRHHWQDILVGGFIGTVFAYFSYRQFYPSLSSDQSDKPFPPRFRRSQDIFPRDDGPSNDSSSGLGSISYSEFAQPSPYTSISIPPSANTKPKAIDNTEVDASTSQHQHQTL